MNQTEFALLLAMMALVAVPVVILGWRAMRPSASSHSAAQGSDWRFGLALASSSDGLWYWDLSTQEARYSPGAHAQLGLDTAPGGHVIDAFFERVHPDERLRARAVMAAHLQHRAAFELEARLLLQAGEYRWFLLRGEASRDTHGHARCIAGSISDVTERRHAAALVERRARQQGLIAEYGQFALKNPELDDLFAEAVATVNKGIDAEFCRLLVVGGSDEQLRIRAGSGWYEEWACRTLDAAEETQDRFIIGARQAIVVDDFEPGQRLRPSPMLRAHEVRSCAETLICGVQESYGVLGVYSRQAQSFSQETLHFLLGVTNTLAAALDRKATEERLTHLAQFDPLTGLPNRNLYLDRLWHSITEAERDHSPVGVLFVDLDRFKIVNDTLGHDAGDQLLLEVAKRLQHGVRPIDTVGRLGGDEFAVSLVHLAKAEDAGSAAVELRRALSRPFELRGQNVYISASIGISIFPTDGRQPDELLRNADTAMYRAKQSGRDGHQFFFAEMNDRSVERLNIEAQLRHALEHGEFRLQYQPKVALTTGGICGFEALLRWQHRERGLVPPGEFIAILEDIALIAPVTEWVLATVCKQINRWAEMGLPPTPVAVNLSARQFNERNLDTVLGKILENTGVPPSLVEFELTESMLMTDPEQAARTLNHLKSYGVRLALDDFGTGYSSLAYLKRFPLDSLKIDRSFIRDVATDASSATIATAIINLAKSLGMKVVAEGVETEAQVAFLRQHACDEMQGYYFARPMAPEDAARALEEGWRLKDSPGPGRESARTLAVETDATATYEIAAV